MTNKTLRNSMGLASLSALALVMVACGGSSSSSTPATPTNGAPSAPVIVGPTTAITLHPAFYNLSATDPEGDAITYLVNGTAIAGNTYTLNASAAGATTFSVVARDSKGASSSASTLTVQVAANRAPQFISTATAQLTGSSNTIAWNTFSVAAQDPDTDDVAYSVTGTPTFVDNTGAAVTGCTITVNNTTGAVNFAGAVPAGKTSVTATFTAKAEDKLPGQTTLLGASATQVVTMTYFNGNLPPTILTTSLPPLPANHYIPVAQGQQGFLLEASDPNGDALTWSLQSGTTAGLVLTTTSGTQTYLKTGPTFTPVTSGALVVNVRVTDARGLYTDKQFNVPVVIDSIPTLNSNVYTETVSGVEAFNTGNVKWDITANGSLTNRSRFYPGPVDWLSWYTPSWYAWGIWSNNSFEPDHAPDAAATDLPFSNFSGAYAANTWLQAPVNSALPSAGWMARTLFKDAEGDGIQYAMQGGSVFVSGTYHSTVGQTFTLTGVDGATATTLPALYYFVPMPATWANRGEYPGVEPTHGTLLWRPVLIEDPDDINHATDNLGNSILNLPAVWSFTVLAKERVWNPNLNGGAGGYDPALSSNQGAQNYSVKVQPNNRPYVGPLTTIPGVGIESIVAPDAWYSNAWIGGGTNSSPTAYGRPSIQEPESKPYGVTVRNTVNFAGTTGFPYDQAAETTAKWRWFFAWAGGNGSLSADVQIYDPDQTNITGHMDTVYADVPTQATVNIGGVETTPVPFVPAGITKIYNPWVNAGGTPFQVEWGPSRQQYLLARMAGFTTIQLPVNVWDQYERQNNSGATVYPMFGTVRIANARDVLLYDLAPSSAAARGTFLSSANANDPATGSDSARPHYNFQYLPLVGTEAPAETYVTTHLFDGVMPQSGTDGSGYFLGTSWITLYSTEVYQSLYHNTNPLNDEPTFNPSTYSAAVQGSSSSSNASDWRTFSMVGGIPVADAQRAAAGSWSNHEARAHVIPSNSPYQFAVANGVENDFSGATNYWGTASKTGYFGNYPSESNGTANFQPRTYQLYNPADAASLLDWEVLGAYYAGQRQGEIDYQRSVAGRTSTRSLATLTTQAARLRWTYTWPTLISNANLGKATGGANTYQLEDVLQMAVPNLGGNARWFFTGNDNFQGVNSWGRHGLTGTDTTTAPAGVADTGLVLGAAANAWAATNDGFTSANTAAFHTVTDSIWVPNNSAGTYNIPNSTTFTAGVNYTQLPFHGVKGYLRAASLPGIADQRFGFFESGLSDTGNPSTDTELGHSNPPHLNVDPASDRIFYLWMKRETTAGSSAWGTWGAAVMSAGAGYTATGTFTTVPAFNMAQPVTLNSLTDTFAQVSFATGSLPGVNQAANAGVGFTGENSGFASWQRSQWAQLAPAMGPVANNSLFAYNIPAATLPVPKSKMVNPDTNTTTSTVAFGNVANGFHAIGATATNTEGGVRDSFVIYAVRDRGGNRANGANFGAAGIEPGSPVLAQWHNLTQTNDTGLAAATLDKYSLTDVPAASFPAVLKAFYSPFRTDISGFRHVAQAKMNFVVGMNYPNAAATAVRKIPASIEQTFPLFNGAIVDPTCTNANNAVDPGRPILSPVRLLRILDYKTNYTSDLERVNTVIDLVNSDPSDFSGTGAQSLATLPLDIASKFGTGIYSLSGTTWINQYSTTTLAWQSSVNNQVIPSGYFVEMFLMGANAGYAGAPNMLPVHSWRVPHIGGREAVQTLHMPATRNFTSGIGPLGPTAYFFRVRSVWAQDGAGVRIDFEKEPTRLGIPYATADFISAPFIAQ